MIRLRFRRTTTMIRMIGIKADLAGGFGIKPNGKVGYGWGTGLINFY